MLRAGVFYQSIKSKKKPFFLSEKKSVVKTPARKILLKFILETLEINIKLLHLLERLNQGIEEDIKTK